MEALASQARSTVRENNITQSNSGSSLSWQSTCGDPYVPGQSWWAVKEPTLFMTAIANNPVVTDCLLIII
jgi:hypothetical protein